MSPYIPTAPGTCIPTRRSAGSRACAARRPIADMAYTIRTEDDRMQITDILAQTGGLQSMARELGISETEAATGAAALTPAIMGGFKKQAQTHPGGIEGLGGLLGKLGGGGLLENVLSPQRTDVSQGNNVLGQIFGSKDVSRTVADDAATKTGLDPSVLKKMLPILAMLVAGYMAKQRSAAGPGVPMESGGGLGGVLGGMLGGGGMRGAGGGGGLASMLDMNGNGNPLDDILGMAGRMRR